MPTRPAPKPPSLPIISLASFLSLEAPQEVVVREAARLNRACTEHGFFYLSDHGIPQSTLDAVLNTARRFFLEASPAEKDAVKRREAHEGGDGARGYQLLGENLTKGKRDWHEALDFYSEEFSDPKQEHVPDLLHDGLLRGRNPWPKHPADFQTVYEGYIEQVKHVGTALVRAMQLALSLEADEKDAMVSETRKSFWVLRAIGYPPLKRNVDGTDADADAGISCGEHTDYGCVTLLLADSTPGALQVQSKDGAWLDADPVPGAFVVNIGDMVERWTNGEWKSTLHRVVHGGGGFRVSVPFFFEPDFDAEVGPLRTCVRKTGGRERWGRVRYGEHLVGKIRGNFYGG